MEYKFLVATDIDNTLLITGTDVSAENRRAIKAIEDAGGAFTLATGRSFYLIGKYAEDLKLTVPCIVSNGGGLADPVANKEIKSYIIDKALVRELMLMLWERKINFAGYSSEGVFFAPTSDRREFFENYNRTAPEGRKAVLCDLTLDMIQSGNMPVFNKILTVEADPDTCRELRARKDISCCASTATFLDIMAPGATKGRALLDLADLLGVSRDMTFALGDNENDIEMLRDAEYGIAMGNATEETKAACDYVTTDCKDDGFAKAVFDIILPKICR